MALVATTKLKNALDLQQMKAGGTGVFELIREIQGLKVNVLAGAAVDTNIAVTGIATTDTILTCLQVEPDDGTASTMLTDRTAETTVTSAGNIQLGTTDTTGKQLLFVWYDKA